MVKLQAATRLNAARKTFTNLEEWKAAAKAKDLRVKAVSKTKNNTYWQAISKEGKGIVGFFNDFKPESGKKAGGEL